MGLSITRMETTVRANFNLLFNNIKNLFEPVTLGNLQQLEQGRFHAGYFGAGALTLFQADMFVFDNA